MYILKYSKDTKMRKLYNYVLSREMFKRNIGISLRKFTPPSKLELPDCLKLEAAERQVQLQKIRGNGQSNRKGLRVSHRTQTSNSSLKGKRQATSAFLKKAQTNACTIYIPKIIKNSAIGFPWLTKLWPRI